MTTGSHQTNPELPSASPGVVAVWDLGVRLYHWLQALLVTLLLASGFSGNGDTGPHIFGGVLLATLLCWRWIWGLVGGTASRFSRFPLKTGELRQYLKFGKHPEYGHNPLAAWMVIALLIGLSLQVISGMIMSGLIHPGDRLLSSLEPVLVGWHAAFPKMLLVLIALHIAAALRHGLKRDRVITAMLDGQAAAKPGATPVRVRSGKFAALIFLSAILFATLSILSTRI